MAGMRLLPEDSDISQARPVAAPDLISDDDRSVAADSWSIKSEYRSTLDDEQRHADATEALSAATFRGASDYNSDKDEQDGEPVSSMLGFQSYWDASYADELANFREHGHSGEVWFGADVMEILLSWTKSLCLELSQAHLPNHVADGDSSPAVQCGKDLSNWNVLDVGTGNGLLLQELSKLGTKDELIQEAEAFNQRRNSSSEEPETTGDQEASRDPPPFRYLDHVRSYPTFMFGGSVGSRVATVAFVRN